MANANTKMIDPIKATGTQHQIERTYRESGTFQWARETFKNADESGATRIEFGIEWQGVESKGVYRRTISDNGRGMSAAELVEFFNTFGGGGKPIGGVHENFGVGSKTSLLPWNRSGVVVISWQDGEASMIWLMKDPVSGEYGLRVIECVSPETGETSLEVVYSPFADTELGVDWSSIKPDWIEDHGTVVILLGNDPSHDTVLGDPERNEADIKGLSSFLNRRLWEVPDTLEIYVDELRTSDRKSWPASEFEAHTTKGGGADKRTNFRRIRGARYFVNYEGYKDGHLASSGTVTLLDGTEVDWHLWNGDRPDVHSYAAKSGYVAALYRNELYDVTSHIAIYRSFGVTESAVRSSLWIVLRPQMYDEAEKKGVYPRTDRNALLIKGGPAAGDALPIADWGAEFADNMPAELLEAIRAARAGGTGTIGDEAWKERLAERFGSRWKIDKYRKSEGGSHRIDATQLGGTPRSKPARRKSTSPSGGNGGSTGRPTIGSGMGPVPAKKTRVAGGIPSYRIVSGKDIEEGMLAAWSPNDVDHPEGVVLINGDHSVIEDQVRFWQERFASHHEEEVRDEVRNVYGEIAVAKVAHSEHMRSVLPATTVEKELRSNAALTMALLGLIGEEAVLAPRLAAKLGRRRNVA